jgi:signal transduction histidine kinase
MDTKLLHPLNLWRRLTNPPASLLEPELRRRSSLLLSILVILTAIALADLVYQGVQLAFITDPSERRFAGVVFPLILGASLVCIFIAYVLGRTGHTASSALTVVGTVMVGSWVLILLTRTTETLSFPVVGVVLASIVLAQRQTLAILFLAVLELLAVPLFVPTISYWSFSLAVVSLLAVGMLSFVSALVHDRDLKQIEEQTRALIDNQEKIIGARKMEAIARLSAGIAHEFNNIATAIVGYSDVIASQPAQSVGQYAGLIKGAGLRAGRLTEQLLSFSRQQLLNPRATDLNQLVARLEHLLRSTLSERIKLALRLDPEPRIAFVDPELIEQVIRTLLLRAGENVRDGGDVVVGTGAMVVPPESAPSSARPGRYCAITISDTGPSVIK